MVIFVTDWEEIENKNNIIFGKKKTFIRGCSYRLGFADCPRGCPDIWQPVCGSDKVTYGNRCELNRVSDNPNQTLSFFLASQLCFVKIRVWKVSLRKLKVFINPDSRYHATGRKTCKKLWKNIFFVILFNPQKQRKYLYVRFKNIFYKIFNCSG